MYPKIDTFVNTAFLITKQEKLGLNYGSIIDATCSSCKDFHNQFKKIAKNQLNEKFAIDVAGDTPDLSHIMNQIKKNQIDFILLPNYSKLSGYVISKIHHKFLNIKFLGSDGWGDYKYTFLTNFNIPKEVVGYSFKLGDSPEQLQNLFNVYSLNREWSGEIIKPSITSYLAIDLIRKMTFLLCRVKPKNKSSFTKFLSKQNKDFFRTIRNISVYKISNNQPKHYRTIQNVKS